MNAEDASRKPPAAGLEDIKRHMLEMGGVVEKQFADAMEVIRTGDGAVGRRVAEHEDELDAMEVRINEECHRIIIGRQLEGGDLRLVLAVIKSIRDLERIGDETAKIAKSGVRLAEGERAVELVATRELGDRVSKMVNMALNAFVRADAEAARAVVREDESVDREYRNAMRSMIGLMKEDPEGIGHVLNVLWALRALERIGDHAQNIAEHVIYLVRGEDARREGPAGARPGP